MLLRHTIPSLAYALSWRKCLPVTVLAVRLAWTESNKLDGL